MDYAERTNHLNDTWKADVKAAKELCYPKSVVEALKHESDSNKRARILIDARHNIK